MSYSIVVLRQELAEQVRRTGRAVQYRHAAEVSVATGYGPCRVCLDRFVEGQERRILFTYNPVTERGAWPQPGPVFIHERHCEEFQGSGLPDWLRQEVPLFVEGFGAQARTVQRVEVVSGDVAAAVEQVWANPAMEYAHLRNGEAGCFIARLERA